MQARDPFAIVAVRDVTRRAAATIGSRGDRGRAVPAGRGLLLTALAILSSLVFGAALAGAELPLVSIEAASNVEYTTATVEGEVNPTDHGTSFHFEYATQAQFEASEWGEAAAAGFGYVETGAEPAKPTQALSGLAPGTTYHLRLVAENTEGEHV